MKKFTVLQLLRCLIGGILLLFLGSFIYMQIVNDRAKRMVKLADVQQQQLIDYQRQRLNRYLEFKVEPRQSNACAGRFYCIEQACRTH